MTKKRSVLDSAPSQSFIPRKPHTYEQWRRATIETYEMLADAARERCAAAYVDTGSEDTVAYRDMLLYQQQISIMTPLPRFAPTQRPLY